jgi:hypothetical protein
MQIVKKSVAIFLMLVLLLSISSCKKDTTPTKSSSKSSGNTSLTSGASSDGVSNFSSSGGSSVISSIASSIKSATSNSSKTISTVSSKPVTPTVNNYGETGDTSFKLNIKGLAAKTIYRIESDVINKSGMQSHDVMRMIVSLQGLINREYPTNTAAIYLLEDSQDLFWLNYITGSGKFLSGYQTVKITTFEQFFALFKGLIKECGIVEWDSKVPSTANVAQTICGLDGFLPIRYDTASASLYARLLKEGVTVKKSLVNKFTGKGIIPDTKITSSGSSKCDAYLWAIDKYMDRCSNKYIAYMPDGASTVIGNPVYVKFPNAVDPGASSIPNFDYLIARRAFFFDLSPVGTEKPCDDLNQPLGKDLEVMKTILKKRYDMAGGTFGQVIGFTPWWLKYTNFNNQGTLLPTVVEWICTEITTAYNLAQEADAMSPNSISNASIYYKSPKKSTYTNNKPATKMVFDKNKYYFSMYMGDYDSSAWLKQHIPTMWKDTTRGKIPLMWVVNPNLVDRFPVAFDYMHENISANDYFTTGDGGAGYIIPAALYKESGIRELPDGGQQWVDYNKSYSKLFNLDITGFIINGNNILTKNVMNAYNSISPLGSFQNQSSQPLLINNGVPYMHIMNGEGITSEYTMDQRVTTMYNYTKTIMQKYNFSAFRSGIQTPSQIKRQSDAFIAYAKMKGKDFVLVDPYTMFDLIKQSKQGTVVG